MLKACSGELGEPLWHVFNMSLHLTRVPVLWKTSCLIPVRKKEKKNTPVSRVTAQDPLKFAYQAKVSVEDAVLYLLHRA